MVTIHDSVYSWAGVTNIIGGASGGATVDLTEINTKLDDITLAMSNASNDFTLLDGKIDSVQSSLDNNFPIDISALELKIDTLKGFDFSGSLNGSAGSFIDGAIVSIDGYEGQYTVDSSNVMKYDESLHILVYRVVKDGKYFNVPSNMVSLYVAPVV